MIVDKHLSLDEFRKIFRTIEASDFLTGKKPSSTGTQLCATLEWILQPEHWESIAEGKYDNRERSKANDVPSFDLEAYERSSLNFWNKPGLRKLDGDEGVG